MDESSCCSKAIAGFLGAISITLLLVVDLGTTYGAGPGEATVAMFDGASQVVLVVVYILALAVYPFLQDRPAWLLSVVAFAAAIFTAGGVAGWLVVMPLVSAFLAVLYISPAGWILLLSAIEISNEMRTRKQERGL